MYTINPKNFDAENKCLSCRFDLLKSLSFGIVMKMMSYIATVYVVLSRRRSPTLNTLTPRTTDTAALP
jgi:hypothetical protein